MSSVPTFITGNKIIFRSNLNDPNIFVEAENGKILKIDRCIINEGVGDTGTSTETQLLYNKNDEIVGTNDMRYEAGDTYLNTANTSLIRRTTKKDLVNDDGISDLQTNIGTVSTDFGRGVAIAEVGTDLWTFLLSPYDDTNDSGLAVYKNNVFIQTLFYTLASQASDLVGCAVNEDASRVYYSNGSRSLEGGDASSVEWFNKSGDTYIYGDTIETNSFKVKASGNYVVLAGQVGTIYKIYNGISFINSFGGSASVKNQEIFDITTSNTVAGKNGDFIEIDYRNTTFFNFQQNITSIGTLDLSLSGNILAILEPTKLHVYERVQQGFDYTLVNSLNVANMTRLTATPTAIITFGTSVITHYVKYDGLWVALNTTVSKNGRPVDSVASSENRFIYGSRTTDTYGSSRNYLLSSTYLNTLNSITLTDTIVKFFNDIEVAKDILVNQDLLVGRNAIVENNITLNGFINNQFQVNDTSCISYNTFKTSTNGTASAPIYSTLINPATGMWLSSSTVGLASSGQPAFTTNLTETTSLARFRCSVANGDMAYTFTNDITTGTFLGGSGIYGIRTAGTNRMTLDATHFVPFVPVRPFNFGDSVNPSYSWVGDRNTGMYMISSGNIGFSTSQQTNIFMDRANSIKIRGGFSTLILFTNTSNSGTVGSVTTNNISTFYNTTSDRRLKQNIRVMPTCGLDIIKQLRPVMYEWKSDPNLSTFGLIAQEVKLVLPEIVEGNDEDVNEDNSIKPMAIDYSKLVPHLICAIKTLNKNADLMRLRIKLLEDNAGF
jgi:hypothetical protein